MGPIAKRSSVERPRIGTAQSRSAEEKFAEVHEGNVRDIIAGPGVLEAEAEEGVLSGEAKEGGTVDAYREHAVKQRAVLGLEAWTKKAREEVNGGPPVGEGAGGAGRSDFVRCRFELALSEEPREAVQIAFREAAEQCR